ncbi:NAD(P)-binding domain-containing protein [Actinomadura sp. ATCC 31491]|uniref:NAD(P)-binding domain-containing protein n=1 Tax=Actinomadura luzonensis TaxID=2805427 RepID=A0ABT0FY61_9ACTN|nr:NAD(P)-binding domain-containing protein [Actinomadura luzonensis]MCK2216826.1 NAD(P)-binding domain-containing protein [Actinomadura luzonensis]
MRIGILGAGGMADALGTQWARAGHEIMISGRDAAASAARARAMTQAAGATGAATGAAAGAATGVATGVATEVAAGSWAEAARFGEVVVVAVREAGLADVLAACGGALRGKPLVDVTNAADPARYDPARSPAALIGRLSGGHVVKAFNLCHVDVWRMTPPVFGGRPLAVPLCGDDPAALAAARTLTADLGCTPLDGGGLARVTQLEATAAFMIGLWFGGADAQAVLPPLAHSGAHPGTHSGAHPGADPGVHSGTHSGVHPGTRPGA